MSETTIIETPAAAPVPVAAPTAAPAPSQTAAPAPTAAAPAPAPAAKEPPAAAPPPKPAWPDNWRDLTIGDPLPETATEDEKTARSKLEAMTKRYNSPADMAKALRAAQLKISDGTLKSTLPKNATSEQITEWRKENGIPEAPEKYDLGLPQGTVLSDADKALVDLWVKDVHGANASPDIVKAGAAAFLKAKSEAAERTQQANLAAKQSVEDTLRTEWGTDYRTNVDGIQSMLGQAPESVSQAIFTARGPDGVAMLNNPQVVRWLAGHARELGYVGATIVPSGGDLGQSLDAEIASIEKRIREDNDGYRKDAKMQKRYGEVLAAKERRK